MASSLWGFINFEGFIFYFLSQYDWNFFMLDFFPDCNVVIFFRWKLGTFRVLKRGSVVFVDVSLKVLLCLFVAWLIACWRLLGCWLVDFVRDTGCGCPCLYATIMGVGVR